jgi:hypothetical protein
METLWSLRWSLLFSIALGLALVLISYIGTAVFKFEAVIWVVVICVSMTLAKVFIKRNEFVVALFGLGGVFLAKFINDQTLLDYDIVDVVRIVLYPILGWSVIHLERTQLARTAPVLEAWLFPMVVLPLTAGVIIAVTDGSPTKVVAEIVFAAGCAVILHMQKVPEAVNPLVMVVTAFVTGAAASKGDKAVQAIKDAHANLKGLITRKASGASNAEDLNAMLRIVEKKPEDSARHRLLHDELKAAGVNEDIEVLKQSHGLLRLIEQHEPKLARQYHITLPDENGAFGEAIKGSGFTSVEGMRLYQVLTQHFSQEEVESLCAELDVDIENLPSPTNAAKARTLAQQCEKSGRLEELKKLMRVMHSDLREQLQ